MPQIFSYFLVSVGDGGREYAPLFQFLYETKRCLNSLCILLPESSPSSFSLHNRVKKVPDLRSVTPCPALVSWASSGQQSRRLPDTTGHLIAYILFIQFFGRVGTGSAPMSTMLVIFNNRVFIMSWTLVEMFCMY